MGRRAENTIVEDYGVEDYGAEDYGAEDYGQRAKSDYEYSTGSREVELMPMNGGEVLVQTLRR